MWEDVNGIREGFLLNLWYDLICLGFSGFSVGIAFYGIWQ